MPRVVKGKRVLGCSCGYVAGDSTGELRFGGAPAKEERRMEIISDEGPALPIVDAKCKKCGNLQAYHWEQQTRAGDEPATRFYRCTKCQHTWREYK
jgi:DNA-directed RNA polymerase subunit M